MELQKLNIRNFLQSITTQIFRSLLSWIYFTPACSKGNASCILISSNTMLSFGTMFFRGLPNMRKEGSREMCSSTSRISVAGTVFPIVALQAQLGKRMVALHSSHKNFSWLEIKFLNTTFHLHSTGKVKDLSGVYLPFWILLLRRDKRTFAEVSLLQICLHNMDFKFEVFYFN